MTSQGVSLPATTSHLECRQGVLGTLVNSVHVRRAVQMKHQAWVGVVWPVGPLHKPTDENVQH